MVYTITFTSGKELTFISKEEIEQIKKKKWLKMDDGTCVNVGNIETIVIFEKRKQNRGCTKSGASVP